MLGNSGQALVKQKLEAIVISMNQEVAPPTSMGASGAQLGLA
jgi:hypothetical protein